MEKETIEKAKRIEKEIAAINNALELTQKGTIKLDVFAHGKGFALLTFPYPDVVTFAEDVALVVLEKGLKQKIIELETEFKNL